MPPSPRCSTSQYDPKRFGANGAGAGPIGFTSTASSTTTASTTSARERAIRASALQRDVRRLCRHRAHRRDEVDALVRRVDEDRGADGVERRDVDGERRRVTADREVLWDGGEAADVE